MTSSANTDGPALPLAGGCHCGQARYRIDRLPANASICHCATCRRTAGADSVAWASIDRGAFVLEGETTGYASSRGVERRFCGRCGTALTYDVGGATIDVTLASLDDPEALRPDREIWVEHRLTWNAPHPDLPQDRRE